jgi:hypothetical protein
MGRSAGYREPVNGHGTTLMTVSPEVKSMGSVGPDVDALLPRPATELNDSE